MFPDLPIVMQWWLTMFLVGIVGLPLGQALFSKWKDGGYFFSKALGLAITTYLVYVLGVFHISPFTLATIVCSMMAIFGISYFFFPIKKVAWKKFLLAEIFFLTALVVWSWVKAHEPSIHGLEKFMDFGFTKSILNSHYFPAADMWYAGKNYINYYYFGHTALALLTRLSGLDLSYTFNLILATLFAFTASMSFSLALELTQKKWVAIITSYIVTLGGNLQTIYAFTQGYNGEKTPPPFWTIFTGKLDPNYWYANATRFIPFTIHEFPSYSFVVSDIHGHVLSLPFVLLAIGMLIEMFWHHKHSLLMYLAFGVLGAILLMTNALDGPIYMGMLVLFTLFSSQTQNQKIKALTTTVTAAGLASVPFLAYFKSFVSGVGVNCPPSFLANSKIGPLLFESVDKCQRSPIWMLLILWGFFLYCGIWLFSKYKIKDHLFLFLMFLICVGLIIFSEFFYFKDIYPLHFRSNTMFKLGYQAFIMLGLVSGVAMSKIKNKLFWLGVVPLLFLVSIFPYFSVKSYFNSLKEYQGLDGLTWLASQYPDDYQAIDWINNNTPASSVVLEADGDSYTDYARISAFTGRQTIIGWAVHEWLWRGTYDTVAPRREEVRQIYEGIDTKSIVPILSKYHVNYIVVGAIERKKYTQLNESKFLEIGKVVFSSGATTIYSVTPLQSLR